jgi:hypothetical protein
MASIQALLMAVAAGGGSTPVPGYVVFQTNNQGMDGDTAFVDDTGIRTLTAVGNAQTDDGDFIFGNSSALFDGSGDGVDLSSEVTFTYTQKWALQLWFRPRLDSYTGGTTSLQGLTVRANSGGNDVIEEVYWHNQAGNNRRIFGNKSGNKDVLFQVAGATLTADTWYYLLMQNDPSASQLRTYLAAAGGSLTLINTVTNRGLRFQTYGYSIAASTDYHDGSIGPIRISDNHDVPLTIPTDLFEGGETGFGITSPYRMGYTGADNTSFVAPTTGTYTFRLWGAGGGSNFNVGGGDAALGGAGGFLKFDLALSAGDVVTARVGGAGNRGVTGSRRPGSGGGRTEILVNGTRKAVAGAGGGGGGYGNSNTESWGGEGGGTSGLAGQGGATNSGGATPGLGGTSSAGGTGGTPGPGSTGASLQGGNGAGSNTANPGGWPNGGAASNQDERGGGGGDGYYGGGGGGGNGTWGNAGGGGSSWTHADCSNITHTRGVKNAAPGTGETGYLSGTAIGGQNGNNGGNGRIVITW